jgi:hypothetical protein
MVTVSIELFYFNINKRTRVTKDYGCVRENGFATYAQEFSETHLWPSSSPVSYH